MSEVKLNQIIAIEKGIKGRNHSEVTRLYKDLQHQELFNGISKKYDPLDEEGMAFPDEINIVQKDVEASLEAISKSFTELMDVTATKDFGNTTAKADIVLPDGAVLMEAVPTTYILFLEKQL